MTWIPIRKTSTLLHVDYSYTTATLFAEAIQIRVGDHFDLSIDLNKNLHGRDKDAGTYIDARELADGEIRHLSAIQIDDDDIVKRIGRWAMRSGSAPKSWRLRIDLQGTSWFVVRPEIQGDHVLVLKVSGTELTTRGD